MFVIDLKEISKNYGTKKVLNSINLTINENDCIGILGANGSGKTTLVEIICQIKTPSSGEIKSNFSNQIKDYIGAQFQDSGSWPNGIVGNDILKLYEKLYPNQTKKKIEELIAVFSVKEFLNRNLNHLSGGQKQRFNALLAFFNNPKIIVLDEITTGLDLEARHKILSFLKKEIVEDSKTLLLVSHIPEEVEYLCNRIILLDQGKLILDLPLDLVREKFQSVLNLMNLHFQGKLNT